MTSSVSRLEGTDEFKILSSLVRQPSVSVADTTQSILDLSLSIASNTIKNPYPYPYTLGLHCEQLFESVIDIASRTPIPRQLKLVEFLIQLPKQAVIDPATNTPLKCDGKIIWTELPRSGISFRGEWNFDPRNINATTEEKISWENKTAFVAQVTALSTVDDSSEVVSRLNFSIYALWAMRDAFEDAPAPSIPTDTALRAACLWFIYAGDTLLKNVESRLVFEENVGLPGDAYRRKGWRGFNSERLDVWKNGLRAAQMRQEGETRNLVEQALAKTNG